MDFNKETPQAVTDANDEKPYSAFTTNEKRSIVALVALAGWFSTLSSFIYYPALSDIAKDIGTSISRVNLTVTSYLIVSGIAPSIVGDAADRFGRRSVYIAMLSVYVCADIGVALQSSFPSLLVLRMLQSAGVSVSALLIPWVGTFSVAYGVVADIASPDRRGAFVGALSFGLGPLLGGALASGPGWRWIFWLLAILSGSCLVAMILILPETSRRLVENGNIPPPKHSRPMIPGIMRPWLRQDAVNRQKMHIGQSGIWIPNPLKSLQMLLRKDVTVSVFAGGLIYMLYCCIHTSLSTTCMQVYNLSQLQAGLIYLPFGVGSLVATFCSGRLIDHDYRVIAKVHGLSIDRVSGSDLLGFPIEEARLRSILAPTLLTFASVIAYGWTVDRHVMNNTLVIDINHEAPATAQAAFNIVRCTLAAIAVAFFQDGIDSIGVGWTFTILSSFCWLSAALYTVQRKYGMHWRLKRYGMNTTQSPG
ncbi:MFS general substrate transporter [Aureobasidium pullulans]|nr:MFS general substrate transporter [Aureobasidium pullulans]